MSVDIPVQPDPRVTLILHIAYSRADLPDVVVPALLETAVPLTAGTSGRVGFASVADWLDNAHSASADGDTAAESEFLESAVFYAQRMIADENAAALRIAHPALTAVPS